MNSNVEAAFAALEEQSIIGRMNYSCCQTCGSYEIHEEADDNYEGYVFWHEQDNDSFEEDGETYLSYGSFNEQNTSSKSIAYEIIRVLNKYGILVEWDGEVNKRMLMIT